MSDSQMQATDDKTSAHQEAREHVTTAMLSVEKQELARQKAAQINVNSQITAGAIGGEVQRRLSQLDHDLQNAKAMDLGEIQETLLDLETQVTQLDVNQFLEAKPGVLDNIVENISWLRKAYGVMQRAVKKYSTALSIIEQREVTTQGHITGLVNDVSATQVIAEKYGTERDNLLIWALVAEVKLQEIQDKMAELRSGPKTSTTNTDLTTLGMIELTLQKRVVDLVDFANFVDGVSIEILLSNQAENLLISAMRSTLEMQITVFKAKTRQVLSALRMRKAIEINRHNRETTNKLIAQGSQLALQTTVQAVKEGLEPAIYIGVLQGVNQQLANTLKELRETVATKQAEMEKHDSQTMELIQQRQAALAGETVESIPALEA